MKIWELFPEVANAVRASHEEVGLRGHHDFIHAFRVGEVARQVALVEWADDETSHLAGIAGMCHNADRILQKKLGVGRAEVSSAETEKLILSWVEGQLSPRQAQIVINAVLKHGGKNGDADSTVLIALMDGDRVVNMDVDLFPRSGQFYADLPVVDYRHLLNDPEATYRNPKSVFRDIAYSLDWADEQSGVCVRTQLGKRMVAKRVGLFHSIVEALKSQLEEEGILPYPFKS